jgi:ribonuclease HI
VELIIDCLAKPEAKRAVQTFPESLTPHDTLVTYTDGTAHPEEGLGEAAVTADNQTKKLSFLGPPGMASNFECELVGIQLGLEIGKEALSRRHLKRIVILTDIQAAIERLQTPGLPKSGQYLLDHIQDFLDTIDVSTDILVRWCLGHSGLVRNKAAEARNPSLLDPTVCTSLKSKKAWLLLRQKSWRGSPRSLLPMQSSFHQL